MLQLAAFLFSACLLTGCGGEARLVSPTIEVAPQQATPASSQIPATPVPRPSIEPVVWATSVDATTQSPSETVTSFAADTLTIYACVPVNHLGDGTKIEASWTYNGTSLDAFATQLILPDDAPRRWIAFHISRDPNVSWPAGTYAISIAINGDVFQSASVEIAAAG
jgi:hypothetical protein